MIRCMQAIVIGRSLKFQNFTSSLKLMHLYADCISYGSPLHETEISIRFEDRYSLLIVDGLSVHVPRFEPAFS